MTKAAPFVDIVGLYSTWVSALAEPVKIWFSFSCHKTVMSGDPGVTGVTSSGLRVAGLRMCRWPVSEPTMIFADVGENWMFEVGKREDVEVWVIVVTGVLNFLVSQSLIVSSPPLLTTSRPSELISSPLVHVSLI